MKNEQRLATLTRQLASARRDGDQEEIDRLEDMIDALEMEMEEEYSRAFDRNEDW